MLIIRWPKSEAPLRLRFSAVEMRKLVLKGLISNPVFSFSMSAFFFKQMQYCFFKLSLSFFRNSCLFTGNSKVVFSLFKLSSHSLKSNASHGNIVGMRKSSF